MVVRIDSKRPVNPVWQIENVFMKVSVGANFGLHRIDAGVSPLMRPEHFNITVAQIQAFGLWDSGSKIRIHRLHRLSKPVGVKYSRFLSPPAAERIEIPDRVRHTGIEGQLR